MITRVFIYILPLSYLETLSSLLPNLEADDHYRFSLPYRTKTIPLQLYYIPIFLYILFYIHPY